MAEVNDFIWDKLKKKAAWRKVPKIIILKISDFEPCGFFIKKMTTQYPHPSNMICISPGHILNFNFMKMVLIMENQVR